MKKLEDDTDILFGSKYVANSEKKVKIDIAAA